MASVSRTPAYDVLNPPTYWVGSRCYHVLFPPGGATCSSYNYDEEDSYSEENSYKEDLEGGVDHKNDILVTKEGGKFKTVLRAPNCLFCHLIGSKGATKQRIENETKCSISIPAKNTSCEEIVITGPSQAKVREARIKVDLILEQARNKMRPTHFLSFPLNSCDITKEFKAFRDSVLSMQPLSRGVSHEVFQKPEKLHLTLGVMVCLDDDDRIGAMEALMSGIDKFGKSFAPHGGFRIKISGLHVMNDDPSEATVLYARIKKFDRPDVPANQPADGAQKEEGAKEKGDKEEGTEDLQSFVDALVQHMIGEGVMKPSEKDNVKLHMTVMNTSFLEQEGDDSAATSSKGAKKPKETFDARDILAKFNDKEFGIIEVKEVHLSMMHSCKAASGYYTASRVVPLSHRST